MIQTIVYGYVYYLFIFFFSGQIFLGGRFVLLEHPEV